MTSLPCKKTSATRRNCTLPTIGTVPAGRYRRDGKTWIYSDRKETMNESDSALTMPLKSTVHTSTNRHTGKQKDSNHSTGSTSTQREKGPGGGPQPPKKHQNPPPPRRGNSPPKGKGAGGDPHRPKNSDKPYQKNGPTPGPFSPWGPCPA